MSYTEVKRHAAVGERIKIVNAFGCGVYENGAEFTVNRTGTGTPGSVECDAAATTGKGSVNSHGYITYDEYVVLEPVSETDLVRRVSELERRVAELELEREIAKVVAVAAPTNVPELLPLTRDQIVQRAKDDVAELSLTPREGVPVGGGPGTATFDPIDADQFGERDVVSFVVNRDKRTVVALISVDGHVWARGKAKCAPDDVFNAHIGRAIALRRALGLKLRNEYAAVPQSSESNPEHTDTVTGNDGTQYWVAEVLEGSSRPYRLIKVGRGTDGGDWYGRDDFTFIADEEEDAA